MNTQIKEPRKIMIAALAAALLSVKGTFIGYQAKLFPCARAFLGLCLLWLLLVSCASGPTRQEAGNLWCAKEHAWHSKCPYIDLSSINGSFPHDYLSKDSSRSKIGYQIPVGLNTVEVKTLWSNHFMDYIELTLDVKEGRSYVAFSYELEQGQDPNAARYCFEQQTNVEKPSLVKEILRGFWEGLTDKEAAIQGALQGLAPGIVFTAPVWLPIYYIYKHEQSKKYSTVSQDNTENIVPEPMDKKSESMAQPPDSTPDTATKPEDTTVAAVSQPLEPPPVPSARPYDGCCYIWIEDFETKEVVAGTRVPGLNK